MKIPTQTKSVDRRIAATRISPDAKGILPSDCCGAGKCCVGACLPFVGCAGICVPNLGQC